MKKVLFSLLAVVGLLLAANNTQAQAQQLKIGVFDIDLMVQNMPGYRNVDSLLEIYQRDSLAAEYEFITSELKRVDSTYKADSAANKAKTVLDMEKNQRQQFMMQVVYWQNYAQQKAEYKRGMLAQPLYEKVVDAYKKVLDTKKYTLVLKPGTIERGSSNAVIGNIFEDVAKELKMPLPAELGGGQDDEPQQQAPAKPATGAAKPATKK
ncbi:OmpH family outer membrane protein [Deminuibacter soli]|uniref:OmpH family outer membrane protein n=1 Tax=Deminuibacter soli TaxID=2291815 RepID=A0A3E1NRL6_9BACT|nr:OmpH family outer membrane protein [Deminuibacter soli]RFM30484.1 OmpH family outer membrane protein [Deminuibacter soli]